jgi:outer membrane protein assembly factor BamB
VRTATGWTQYQGGPQHTGFDAAAPAPPLISRWQSATGIGDETHLAGLPAPVIDGPDAIIVDREDVTAIDIATGTTSWTLPRDLGPSAPAAVADGDGGRTLVLYTEGGGDRSPSASGSPTAVPTAAGSGPAGTAEAHSTLVAVDASTRHELWRRALTGVSTTGPTVDGGLAVVGADDGTVTAVEVSSGNVRWHQDLGDVVDTPIAADAGVVYVSVRSESRQPPSVVALQEADGKEAWRYTPNTSGLVAGAPTAVGATVYLALSDGTVRAVGAETGLERWASRLNTVAAGGAPAVSDDAVVVVDTRGEVYRLDLATGARRWEFALNTPVYGPAVITGSAVLIADGSGELSALDPATGDRIWRASLGVGPLLTIAVAPVAVVVARTGTSAGLVGLAADPNGVLIDEQSPTIVKPGTLALDWAVAAIPLAVLLIFAGRFLIARLGPPDLEHGDAPAAGAVPDDWEGDEDPA